MQQPVLVLASTGTVGSEVVHALVAAGVPVRAASRHAQSQPERAGVEYIHFDFNDPDTFTAALEGVERIFLLSPVDLEPVAFLQPFLEAATKDTQRKLVFMSAFGVEADDAIPLRQVELLIERADVPFVFLRPNWFMDNFHTHWGGQVQAGTLALPAADSRSAFIDARDIGASAAVALRDDQFNGRGFTLTGPEALSYAEAAAILSQATGREISYAHVEPETFITTLKQFGIPDQSAHHLAGIFEPVRAGYASQPTDDVAVLTGRAPYSLAEYARDRVAQLNGQTMEV